MSEWMCLTLVNGEPLPIRKEAVVAFRKRGEGRGCQVHISGGEFFIVQETQDDLRRLLGIRT
jgi:hypothetical protein